MTKCGVDSHPSIVQRASRLGHWSLNAEQTAITRSLRFPDFREAFAFMSATAAEADAADHHPEWSNVYDRVEILLTTHDVGGLSERDLDMAATIDRLAVEHRATERDAGQGSKGAL